MTAADWQNPEARSVAVYPNGADAPDRAADGTDMLDDDFLLLINAWWDRCGSPSRSPGPARCGAASSTRSSRGRWTA